MGRTRRHYKTNWRQTRQTKPTRQLSPALKTQKRPPRRLGQRRPLLLRQTRQHKTKTSKQRTLPRRLRQTCPRLRVRRSRKQVKQLPCREKRRMQNKVSRARSGPWKRMRMLLRTSQVKLSAPHKKQGLLERRPKKQPTKLRLPPLLLHLKIFVKI